MHTRTDQEFVLLWGPFRLFVVILHFNADAQFVVQKRVTEPLAGGQLRVFDAAETLLAGQIQPPMPAWRKVRAEQQFAFERIGVVVVRPAINRCKLKP